MEGKKGRRGAGLVFVAIMVGAVVSVGALGAVENAAPAATATGCGQHGSPTANPGTATVYYVTATPALLCVTYRFQGVLAFAFQRNVPSGYFYASVYPWVQASGEAPLNSACTVATCPGVTAELSWARHGADAEVSVVYTISSPANLTGLYIVFHGACTAPLYLAFGSEPASVYGFTWTCGPIFTQRPVTNITGFTGMDAITVPWR